MVFKYYPLWRSYLFSDTLQKRETEYAGYSAVVFPRAHVWNFLSSLFQANQRKKKLKITAITQVVLTSVFLQNEVNIFSNNSKLLHFLFSTISSTVLKLILKNTMALTNLTAKTCKILTISGIPFQKVSLFLKN